MIEFDQKILVGVKPADAPHWMDDEDFEIVLKPDAVWARRMHTSEGLLYGLITTHRCKNAESGWDAGALAFDLPHKTADGPPKWKVESWDPLTISPSVQHILVRGGQRISDNCPYGHGFIKGGVWVS